MVLQPQASEPLAPASMGSRWWEWPEIGDGDVFNELMS